MRACLLTILAIIFTSWSRPVLAIDCTKASFNDEKAICADPELETADKRLNETYRRVWRARDKVDRRGLEALQEDWIFMRHQSAFVDDKIDRQFLREDIEQRRDFLEHGEGRSEGRGRLTYIALDSPALRKGDSAVHVSAFKFAVPRTPGERLLNDEIDKKIYYGGSQELHDKSDCRCRDETSIFRAYLSDRFVSVSINSYEYNGGPHGWDETYYLNIDLERGKVAELEDFFQSTRLPKIVALCRRNFHPSNFDELEVDARDASGKIVSVSENFRRTALELANWAFSQTRAQIRFGIGDLAGGYAQGEQYCTLPYADLRPLLKPGKVLPP